MLEYYCCVKKVINIKAECKRISTLSQNSAQHINWIILGVPHWRLQGMSSFYLLLFNAFYLGLELKKWKWKCKLPILNLLRSVETYLLLHTVEWLHVLLRHSFTLMLQSLLMRQIRYCKRCSRSYGGISTSPNSRVSTLLYLISSSEIKQMVNHCLKMKD